MTTTTKRPVADPDEHLASLLDSLQDREPTAEEVQEIIDAMGIDMDVVAARIQADVEHAKARLAGGGAAASCAALEALPGLGDGPASVPANDTLPPHALKNEAPRLRALWIIAAAVLTTVVLSAATAGMVVAFLRLWPKRLNVEAGVVRSMLDRNAAALAPVSTQPPPGTDAPAGTGTSVAGQAP